MSSGLRSSSWKRGHHKQSTRRAGPSRHWTGTGRPPRGERHEPETDGQTDARTDRQTQRGTGGREKGGEGDKKGSVRWGELREVPVPPQSPPVVTRPIATRETPQDGEGAPPAPPLRGGLWGGGDTAKSCPARAAGTKATRKTPGLVTPVGAGERCYPGVGARRSVVTWDSGDTVASLGCPGSGDASWPLGGCQNPPVLLGDRQGHPMLEDGSATILVPPLL